MCSDMVRQIVTMAVSRIWLRKIKVRSQKDRQTEMGWWGLGLGLDLGLGLGGWVGGLGRGVRKPGLRLGLELGLGVGWVGGLGRGFRKPSPQTPNWFEVWEVVNLKKKKILKKKKKRKN